MIDISLLKTNPDNPRTIKDKAFQKLKKKIKEFPDMLAKRPVVYDSSQGYIILGGNRRFDAISELLKSNEISIKYEYFADAKNWTNDQKRKFVVIDNISDGEWDYKKLSEQYQAEELEEWGLPVDWEKELYTRSVKSPIYEPSDEKPELSELVDSEKTQKLISNIQSSNIPTEIKEFLIKAAYRHNVFDYAKIADFYAHADAEVQQLMEDSALIIIDYDKAVEDGFVKLTEEVAYSQEDDGDEE